MNRITVVAVVSILLVACSPAPEGQQEPDAQVSGEATTAPEIHQGYSDTAPLYEVDGNVVSNVDTEAFLWNPRGKNHEQIASRARFLADAATTRTPEQNGSRQGVYGKV